MPARAGCISNVLTIKKRFKVLDKKRILKLFYLIRLLFWDQQGRSRFQKTTSACTKQGKHRKGWRLSTKDTPQKKDTIVIFSRQKKRVCGLFWQKNVQSKHPRNAESSSLQKPNCVLKRWVLRTEEYKITFFLIKHSPEGEIFFFYIFMS